MKKILGRQVIILLAIFVLVMAGSLYIDNIVNKQINQVVITGGAIYDFSSEEVLRENETRHSTQG